MNHPHEGGDLLVESLQNLGVERIFSVSGGPLNSIFRAATDRQLQIVHARHEAAACYMAEATSRISGMPGVAVVTLGPGVTNSITPTLMAEMAGVPLLIVGGQGNTVNFDRGADMSADHVPIMQAFTKFAARVLHAERIPEYVEMAWRIMWSGRPGPAFLEIPIDILSAAVAKQPPAADIAGRVPGLARRDADAVAAALARARRPLLIIGDEVRWEMNAGMDVGIVRQAVERHGLPFVQMRHARGVIDERHELCCGVGNLYANASLRAALDEADLVFVLGHHLECDLKFGHCLRPQTKVIQCYCDPAFIGKNRPVDLGVVSGVAPVLELMCEIKPLIVDPEWGQRTAGAWRDEWAGQVNAATDMRPLHPAVAIDAVRAAAPEDTIFVTGHGNVDYWTDARLRVRTPNSFVRAGQGGTLGAEVPYGIGARFAAPDLPVVIVVGDGAVGFHGVELDTAERYRRPVVIVVLEDLKWGAVALPQQSVYGRDFAVDLVSRDWAKFAEALGGIGIRAETAEEVRNAVASAIASGRPALVQVPVRSVLSPFLQEAGF